LDIFGYASINSPKGKMRKLKNLSKYEFDYETLTAIIGSGASIIEKELNRLFVKAETNPLNDLESKLLLAYVTTLREIKKDYLLEVASVQKELKTMTDAELHALLEKAS
jgi:hypothetical protein